MHTQKSRRDFQPVINVVFLDNTNTGQQQAPQIITCFIGVSDIPQPIQCLILLLNSVRYWFWNGIEVSSCDLFPQSVCFTNIFKIFYQGYFFSSHICDLWGNNTICYFYMELFPSNPFYPLPAPGKSSQWIVWST